MNEITNKYTVYVVVKNSYKNVDINNIKYIGDFNYTVDYLRRLFKPNNIDKNIIEKLQNNISITVYYNFIEYDIISIYGIEADLLRSYNIKKQFINKEYNTKSLLSIDISCLENHIHEIAGIRNELLSNNKNNMKENTENNLIDKSKRVYFESDGINADFIIYYLTSLGAKNEYGMKGIATIGTIYYINGSNNITAIVKSDKEYPFIVAYYKKLKAEYIPSDKELVLAWRRTDQLYKVIGFYNSKDKCLFSNHGERLNLECLKFDYYLPVTPEIISRFKYNGFLKLM